MKSQPDRYRRKQGIMPSAVAMICLLGMRTGYEPLMTMVFLTLGHEFGWSGDPAASSFCRARQKLTIYLETPKRIASLCFLYLIGLMAWTLIQRTVRGNLQKWNTGLPYHRNKPSPRITTRFFFELFPKIQSVTYRLPDSEPVKKVLGMNAVTELACRALCMSADAFAPVMENRA